LQQVLSPLFDPAHPAAIEALGDHVIHCALHRSRRNFQILLAQFFVVHLVHTLVDIVAHFLQAFSVALLAWIELSETFVNLGHNFCRSPIVQGLLLRLHPLSQFRATFLVQAPTGFPEIFGHVVDINGVNGFGEEFFDVALEVVIPIGNNLNELPTPRPEATLVRFAPGNGDRVALGGVGSVHLFVDWPFQLAVGTAAQGVHCHDGSHLSVFGLIAFLAPPLGAPPLASRTTTMPLRPRMRILRPLTPPLLQFRFRGGRCGFAVDLDHQYLSVSFGCGSTFKPRRCMPAQPQDHAFDAFLGRCPVQKEAQNQGHLRITHLGSHSRGITAQQHTKAVAGQSQFHIQGIIPSALAIEIRAPIADLPKDGAQQPGLGALGPCRLYPGSGCACVA